jgi:general secretion pathway protein G
MPARAGLTLTLISAPGKSYNFLMIHRYRMLARGLLHVRAMNTRPNSTSRGFTLVELLIVTAVIGLIAAIAIPNLINAIERGRQARTIGDLRGLGTGIAMYEQDYVHYPIVADWVGVAEIEDFLQAYMSGYNEMDGWRRSFMYLSDGKNYTLASYGMNGTADLPWTSGPIHFFDEDLVVNNGVFIQWPAGVQQ